MEIKQDGSLVANRDSSWLKFICVAERERKDEKIGMGVLSLLSTCKKSDYCISKNKTLFFPQNEFIPEEIKFTK